MASARPAPLFGPGLGDTQQALLLRLKRRGATTLAELARGSRVAAGTLRQHLQALAAQGLVERRGTRRRGRGRPEVVFALTPAAEALFPRREGELLRDLVRFLDARGRAQDVEDFLRQRIAGQRDAALARVRGLTGDARLREAARILAESGFMAEVAPTPDGATLRLCHCPIRDLVAVTRAPCRIEIAFAEELAGRPLARGEYIPDGDAACSYRTRAAWRADVPLAPLTTLGLGGPARWLVECDGEDAVRQALADARARDLPVTVLGGGSNVVVRDAGVPGVVLRITVGGVTFGADGLTADAGAGVSWDAFVRETVDRGLQGVECLSGIPGTVGGTPIQNVGAYGQDVAETIERVTCIDRRTLERVEIPGAECGFGYRTSRFKAADRDRFVVTAVRFRLRPGGAPALRYRELADAVARRASPPAGDAGAALRVVRDAVLELRRGKAMVVDPADPDTRSVGSFFTNPVLSPAAFADLEARWRAAGGADAVPAFPSNGGVKIPAAWLIERAGFRKGLRRGGVGISARHALALVNAGGTAAELLALADEIERAVADRFGVRLEREPVVVG